MLNVEKSHIYGCAHARGDGGEQLPIYEMLVDGAPTHAGMVGLNYCGAAVI